MDLKLAGRSALITGASKGIGLAVAEELAGEGVDVHIASRSEETLRAAAEMIRAKRQVRVEIHPVDIGKPGAAEKLVAACAGVDFLINNAGAIPGGDLDTVDEARMREAWDLKLFGYVNMCRAMLKHMRQRKSGVIVNIIGSAGERHDPLYIAGSTANAGLMAFTRALGGSAIKSNIRVVGINPGPIATDRHVTLQRKRAQDKFGDPERWKELAAGMPLGRAGTTAEISGLVAFLCSERAGYINGTVITVDGGAATHGPH
ncbi:MAG: SDR family oxidoreductase [Alphaproteobacteria bacterium]|nr:SDR family oxidoreductase [Alphaproteobacteria bacterium]